MMTQNGFRLLSRDSRSRRMIEECLHIPGRTSFQCRILCLTKLPIKYKEGHKNTSGTQVSPQFYCPGTLSQEATEGFCHQKD